MVFMETEKEDGEVRRCLVYVECAYCMSQIFLPPSPRNGENLGTHTMLRKRALSNQ